MKLTDINEIKEEGLTVFMPSGIQATLFNEGENILVKYYNLTEDKYSVEDFKKLISEGIEVFNEPVSIPSQSVLMESLKSKGFIKHSLNEAKEMSLKDAIGKDESEFEYFEDIIDYINGQELTSTPKEDAWATIGFGGDIIDVENIYTGEVAQIVLNNPPKSRYVVIENKVIDPQTGKGLEFHDGYAVRIQENAEREKVSLPLSQEDNNLLNRLAQKGYIRKSLNEAYNSKWTTEYCITLKDGTEEWFTSMSKADTYFEAHKDEVYDYVSKEFNQYGDEGDVEIFYRAIDESLNESKGWHWFVSQYPEKDYDLEPCDVALIGINSDDTEQVQMVALCAKKDENPKERYFYEVFAAYPDKDNSNGYIYESSIGDWIGFESMIDALKEWNEVENNEHVLVDDFTPPSQDLIDTAERVFKRNILKEEDETDEQDDNETKIEIEIKDDKVEIEGEIDGKEFEVEQPLEKPAETEEEEEEEEEEINDEEKPELSSFEAELADIQDGLIEADENGEDTLKSFFGLEEADFKTRTELINKIEKETDYEVVSSDDLTLNIKTKGSDEEPKSINLKHALKENDEERHEQIRALEDKMLKEAELIRYNYIQGNIPASRFDRACKAFDKKYSKAFKDLKSDRFVPFNELAKRLNDKENAEMEKVTEAFEQKDCKAGSVYTALKKKEEKKEYLTQEFKLELLQDLDKIAREYPDVNIRKQAIEYMDEVGLQEYYDTEKTIAFVKEYLPILKRRVLENVEKEEEIKESLNPSILVKDTLVEINVVDVSKIDDETYRFVKRIELPDEAFDLECIYYAEQGLYDFKVLTLAPLEDEIDINKQNTYLSLDDKYTIKNLIQEAKKTFEKLAVAETLQEAGNGLENISNDLQDGKKEGFDPVEFGNWICETSMDDKWESLTNGMKAYLLNIIGIEVLGEMALEDLEIKFDYYTCLNSDLDSNDLESLGIFDDVDILEMINGQDTLTMLLSYEIKHDDKTGKEEDVKEEKSEKASLKESLNESVEPIKEEYGEYEGQLDEVANDIEKYNDANEGSFEVDGTSYEWGPLTINGQTWEELALENEHVKEWIRHEIALPIKDGHDYYNGLDCILILGEHELKKYYLDEDCPAKEDFIADMVKLGCDEEKLKDAIDYIKKNGDKDRSDCKEVEWWIDYDINLAEVENEEPETTTVHVTNVEWDTDDEEDLKDLPTDFMLSFEHYPDGDFDEEISDAISDKYGFTHIGFNWIMDESLKEQFKLKAKKKKKKIDDALNEWIKADWHVVLKDGTEKVFDDQAESEKYFNQNFHKDNVEQYYMQALEPETDEVIFKRDLYAEKINENKKGIGKMRKVNEDAYKVYNTIEGLDCGTFNSWNDVQDYLNATWGEYVASKVKENPEFGTDEDKDCFFGNFEFDIVPVEEPAIVAVELEPEVCPECGETECVCSDELTPEGTEKEELMQSDDYVEVEGVTADPDKVDKIDGPIMFTPEETEVLNNLEVGEKVLLPNEQPDTDHEYELGGATEVIKTDINDQSGNDEEVESEESTEINPDIEAFIAKALEDKEVNENMDKKEVKACPTCGKIKCECKKDESFKDGMITDINELDFPDAMHSAVDTNEDGELYKISDIAKEVAELKDSFKSELDAIKNDFKTLLAELKNDIKADVKDIQVDVTSKLDNTDARIADLTAEEEELELENEEPTKAPAKSQEEEEELNLENEAPEKVEESLNADTMEQAFKDGIMTEEMKIAQAKEFARTNPIYEQMKDVIRMSKLEGKKMSVDTLAQKLREEYGVRTDIEVIFESICTACEYTPIKKYIIPKEIEEKLIHEKELGIANRFLKTGLQDAMVVAKENELKETISQITKKAVDKYAAQGEAGKQKIKAAIDLTTDNEQDKEDAIDYAVEKVGSMSESIDTSSPNGLMKGLLKTSNNALFGNIMQQSTGLQAINAPKLPKR